MKILITGAKGFIGKNLIAELRNRKNDSILEIDKDTDPALLEEYTKDCDFVFHLAGINRPKDEKEFMEGNYGFTTLLLNKLKEHENNSPILYTSSIQAVLDTPYGKSKKAAEEVLFDYGKETGSKIFVYRLPNVFGKWSEANYNSVVATFCNNIANDLEIKVDDSTKIMNLVYIDDVVDEFINALQGKENILDKYCSIPIVFTVTLGKIVRLIYSFKETRVNLNVPNMSNEFEKKLYSTYLSYLSKEQFSYSLKMNVDGRGSFTEFLRTPDRGQISVNIVKPGITKGNHWHKTKNEKFLVVRGKGLIQFRKIYTDEIISYHVNGEKLEVVDIPIGYTHNLRNEGDEDLVTVMWVNEVFNPDKPDTYPLEVSNL
ncbi:MAG: capsular polysaccharide biosynthesis protein CapF [Mobilitalea sp.]